MTKAKRRILLGLSLFLLVLILLAGGGFHMLQGTPDWYHPSTLSNEEKAAAANRVDQKFADVVNWAGEVQSAANLAERKARGEPTAPSSMPSASALKTISFSEDEINAAFHKWSAWHNWKDKYERFIVDPTVVLRDGHFIVAGVVKDLDTVASLHFEPKLNDAGELQMELVRVYGGKLPLPKAALSKYRDKAILSLESRLPRWQKNADMKSNGDPNNSTIAAATAQLALHVLREESGEPILFLPVAGGSGVAVKVSNITMQDKTISLTVEPLNLEERTSLLDRIRGTTGDTVAATGS